jgi:hypothetical protein
LVEVGVLLTQLNDVLETIRVGGVVGIADYVAGVEFSLIFENSRFEFTELFEL